MGADPSRRSSRFSFLKAYGGITHMTLRQPQSGRNPTLALVAVAVVALITAGIVSLVIVTGRSAPSEAAMMSPPAKLGVDATASKRPAPDAHHQPTGPSATTPRHTALAAPPSKHPDTKRTTGHRNKPAIHPRHAKHNQSRPTAPKTYTVRRGDTLSGIAHWFHMRGYGTLYAWNRSVIGRNPNLIFPGQTITVTPGGRMTVGG
ncbi:MAG: LysM peptidoglycan-binding domain-containing protein [Gordonia polyisoprenivorans]|nr:LysM peptidoglycan-binding domain-containing protein [Gordonia polyisoprenivorans]